MTQPEFSKFAPTIPTQPGIYKYFDASGKLIYVGKAKNIRKRVSSYFSKAYTSYKTNELVRRIRKIEFTIVNSEHDALLLENSLIKEHQPLFNIDLKDDKTFPFIVVKKEPFPRVFFTRNKINDGSVYYGPYTSVGKVRELLQLVKQNIPLRTCTLNLSQQNINKGKFKVCLEYHLGNCKGPCEGLQSQQEYNESLDQLRDLLKGKVRKVAQSFSEKLQEHVDKLEFEKAAFYQSKINYLNEYRAKSSVANTSIASADIFAILEDDDIAFVSYLAIEDGSIFQTKVIRLQKKLEEPATETLAFAIAQIRNRFSSTSPEIIVPFDIEYPEPNVKLTVPKAGEKRALLDLAVKNVVHFQSEIKARKLLNLEDKTPTEITAILNQLKADLQLADNPLHIECFDNSNFQGSFPVSAMVCFKNGVPFKNGYRKFNIKTVAGINDFASMSEAVLRRYKRALLEEETLPQLVIIDGGKGQLSAAMKSIEELGLKGKFTVVGLAKNVEEIFYPGDSESLKLPYNSESLKLIRRIRDEVHRFGISFHRNQRSKGTFKNELESISGIGKSTADMLIKKYKSVKKVKAAKPEEIIEIVGKHKAAILAKAFNNN